MDIPEILYLCGCGQCGGYFAAGQPLEQNGGTLHTTEHVLAALVGAGDRQCADPAGRPEMPIM